ncbi:MAG: hypothetical protein PWP39_1539 [Pyrococcus sp.]|uniref:hypothetical protein n=1 Tax=Pyrococcus sp. TaxID=33866 RepID=UPI00258C7A89|nr:hypothetical protein [Pyrococcus sp.]MDK2870304.1 hypothetical protein [Pyrococcus sp.]
MSKDLLFWLTILLVLISGYLSYRKKRIESLITAGLAGGFALSFMLYEKFPVLFSFLLGFIATFAFEWTRKR